MMQTTLQIVEPRIPKEQPPARSQKSQRVLACVYCQQRKIKCDRKFPCYNCQQHNLQCVPATGVRRRRQRFPERALLDRIRKYEQLLRQNHVKFEPLHKEEEDLEETGQESGEENPNGESSADSAQVESTRSEKTPVARTLWQAWSQEAEGPNSQSEQRAAGSLESTVKEAWSQSIEDDNMLFGTRKTPVGLSTFHPQTVDILRLWQIYLDNVNPFLKVTHTPSLQVRIINSISDVNKIESSLEALMFSIYCMAIFSMDEDQCSALFAAPKEDLLTKYQFGCQQALLNAGFLQSANRDTLTALFLYILSIRSLSDPRSICHMLGLAIRIAQGMGIHSESALAKCSVFEAEMRRRLWWALVLYDSRRSEMADHKDSSLSPLWDCHVPISINDSELRQEMKATPPQASNGSTESVFIFIRSTLADFVRHTPSHLDFTNPALKPIAKDLPYGGNLAAFEDMIERKYLQSCDVDSPVHFITVWTARAYLAKAQLLEHYTKLSSSGASKTEKQLDEGLRLAFKMMECDTKMMTSPLTIGSRWLLQPYFPFPAYMHILQDLRRRPLSRLAEEAWKIMSSNYEVRFYPQDGPLSPLARSFGRVVIHSWGALEAVSKTKQPLATPPIVVGAKEREARASRLEAEAAGMMEFQPGIPDSFASLMNTSNGVFAFGSDQVSLGTDDTLPYTGLPGQDMFKYFITPFGWSTG
ncbi:Pyriculol/pyriculariol biosynthesis cluster transcription factor [Paramyrothecium foliicola]|nr:Pyriculol/pyriculariol biosynthesis cluster transcription factor [Paramyrothecium foliicola]